MRHSKHNQSKPDTDQSIFEGFEAGHPINPTRCHKDRSFEINFHLFISFHRSFSRFPVACRVFDGKPEQLYSTHTRCSTQCRSELQALIVKNEQMKPKKLTRTACERKPTTRIGSLRPHSSEKGCIPLVRI
ncbi:hypothetical protein MRB53_016409 [Persea americana]|uniref:Uncharacterized protein n=1 Tax=Persea americana TaxID=3435 RepID=A0ACC2M229_PERAE|nr:hypothetical protein MRB53_016409 [Persea americana]